MPLSPRIDDAESFLGLVKFCDDAVTNGANGNPFDNADFATNCGVCLNGGTLITGKTSTGHLGVVVYDADKQIAYTDKATNKHLFPRAIPSLGAATCVGATKESTNTPVLALNSSDYTAFTNRITCQHSKTFKSGCAECVSNNAWSWISNKPSAPTKLYLWGMGKATLMVNNTSFPATTLSMTKSVIDLGPVVEGSTIQIVIDGTGTESGPYLYGATQSTLPNNTLYTIGLEKFLLTNSAKGQSIRLLTPKFFSDVNANLTQITQSAITTADAADAARAPPPMNLSGNFPLTFIQSDELATYDCTTGPFVQSADSWELVGSGDACSSPLGQGSGSYSKACLQKVVSDVGCSANGDWYKNPTKYAAQMSLNDFWNWMSEQIVNIKTDSTVSMGCLGIGL